MSRNFIMPVIFVSAVLVLSGCMGTEAPLATAADERLVTFEEFTLDNGLKVIFHLDRSDPVVAVALTAHVGSAREVPGRTGFAHLFEHLLFLESENLGRGGLDAMSARIGGSGANGSTSRDRTNYFQTVPNDALEKLLWAEADKLGWFINTVTAPVLAKEKQVVKNEKRQSYDNQPYGHEQYVVDLALYPQGHPYNWQVIGSLEDLDAATIEDVKEFYRRWYTPNNITLSLAGDFDSAQARAWVERYFGEIPRGPEVTPSAKLPARLASSNLLYHEDKFAELPQLTLAWPGSPEYAADYYPLQVLAGLLADGKSAPLNTVLIDERQLTGEIFMGSYNSELAGEILLSVRAFDGIDLDTIKAALDDGFTRFETEGIAQQDLARVKTQLEVGFYGNVATVLDKAVALGEFAAIYGDAELINKSIARFRAVTAADVMRVYGTYIKDKSYVATSFVPEGAQALGLEGSTPAAVFEELIVQGAEEGFELPPEVAYEKTPSTFDRSVEPPYGLAPQVRTPALNEATLPNGLRLYAVEDHELPLVTFELAIQGGQLLEPATRRGVANLLAELFDKGTARKTTGELEEALALLGARLDVSAEPESFVIAGQTLARNFPATIDLVREMLLEPRWDESELALAKGRVTSSLQDSRGVPDEIARRAYEVVVWGREHVFAQDLRGTPASLATMTMEDLKSYHASALAPGHASLRVAGAVGMAEIEVALAALTAGWTRPSPPLPEPAPAIQPLASTVYFYDLPGAPQSVFRFGRPGPLRADADYYPAVVMNYLLGGGGFASRLTQELREGKGYTYGVNSSFTASARRGDFRIQSDVRANVTLEAAELARDIVAAYGATFTEEDLAITRGFLLKSQVRAFESLAAKLGFIGNIADYGLPHDYVQQQAATVEAMTVEKIKALADRYLNPAVMHYVIVGDAATQLDRLETLGYGALVLLNGMLE